eukprot:scaffold137776_cov28-Tisochrysis_lutea.AAC.2
MARRQFLGERCVPMGSPSSKGQARKSGASGHRASKRQAAGLSSLLAWRRQTGPRADHKVRHKTRPPRTIARAHPTNTHQEISAHRIAHEVRIKLNYEQ